MVVVMEERASEAQIDSVIARLIELGMDVHRSSGATRTVLGVVGAGKVEKEMIEILDGVHEVLRISEPYKRASRSYKPEDTVVTIDDVRIGGDEVVVMAGPCSAETEEQCMATRRPRSNEPAPRCCAAAHSSREARPTAFRATAKPGLRMLRRAADAHNLKLVSEVMDVSQIELVGKCTATCSRWVRATCRTTRCCASWGTLASPCCSSGAFPPPSRSGCSRPEYILAGGNNDVILCERGIRTFETATRNTFDISAIPVVKKLSHLPVVADPSHGAGRRDMVAQLARAAVAAGVDGLIIEVHNDPDRALSDGAQSMFPAQFDRLMAELRIIAPAIGRSICLEAVSRRGWAR